VPAPHPPHATTLSPRASTIRARSRSTLVAVAAHLTRAYLAIASRASTRGARAGRSARARV